MAPRAGDQRHRAGSGDPGPRAAGLVAPLPRSKDRGAGDSPPVPVSHRADPVGPGQAADGQAERDRDRARSPRGQRRSPAAAGATGQPGPIRRATTCHADAAGTAIAASQTATIGRHHSAAAVQPPRRPAAQPGQRHAQRGHQRRPARRRRPPQRPRHRPIGAQRRHRRLASAIRARRGRVCGAGGTPRRSGPPAAAGPARASRRRRQIADLDPRPGTAERLPGPATVRPGGGGAEVEHPRVPRRPRRAPDLGRRAAVVPGPGQHLPHDGDGPAMVFGVSSASIAQHSPAQAPRRRPASAPRRRGCARVSRPCRPSWPAAAARCASNAARRGTRARASRASRTAVTARMCASLRQRREGPR